MFDNIGEKIKGLAKFCCYAGVVGSVIMAFIMFGQASDAHGGAEILAVSGVLWLFFGPIVSWISSGVFYGFGEIVDAAMKINQMFKDGHKQTGNNQTVSEKASATKEITVNNEIAPMTTR